MSDDWPTLSCQPGPTDADLAADRDKAYLRDLAADAAREAAEADDWPVGWVQG